MKYYPELLRFNRADRRLTWEGETIFVETFPFQYASPDRPAIAMFNNQLWCVYRLVSGSKLAYRFSSPQDVDGQWTGGQVIPDQTTVEGPALAVFKDRLYCVYVGTGGDNSLYYTYWSNVNSSWSDAKKFPKHYSTRGTALAVYDNKLWCVHTGNGRDGSLRYTTSSDGENWSDDTKFPGQTTASAPSLFVKGDDLFCVHRGGGDDEVVYCTSWDRTTWRGSRKMLANSSSIYSSHAPGVAYSADDKRLIMVLKGRRSDTRLFYGALRDGNENWFLNEISKSFSQAGPAVLAAQSTTFCFYRGAES
ncbi:hypothetical protein B0G81_7821 [Paraburkholderia sp. BL6665CI2N2]|nr:hypothetical protein B0G81_7821 [Paraburkholderia sp. BL6665CI2N2]